MYCKAPVMTGLAAALLVGGLSVAAAQDLRASADNTAVNAADRNADLATPGDQSNNPDALRVTANIRKAVIADKTLSTSAHNVKIITSGNTVTLRGPVATAEERARVAALARQYTGNRDLLDQLTVKQQ
jgi:hyperosmotically inducible protein